MPERNGSDAVNQPTDAPAPTIDSTASAPLPVAPATPAPTPLPTVNAEPDEKIHVAAGGKLIVPREDLLAELDDGTEMDLVDGLPKKIRKPDRREWIVLNRASEFTIRLLIHKPKADGIEVEHYHIAMPLRDPIRDEFKSVRIFLYYSLKTKTYNLWVLNVTIDNTWYESLAQLFKQPSDFFEKNAIRIVSDKTNQRYRVKFKPFISEITWPTEEIGVLLAEALGRDRLITSPDHPLYRDLIEGTELS